MHRRQERRPCHPERSEGSRFYAVQDASAQKPGLSMTSHAARTKRNTPPSARERGIIPRVSLPRHGRFEHSISKIAQADSSIKTNAPATGALYEYGRSLLGKVHNGLTSTFCHSFLIWGAKTTMPSAKRSEMQAPTATPAAGPNQLAMVPACNAPKGVMPKNIKV
jgi:hypothetical protein